MQHRFWNGQTVLIDGRPYYVWRSIVSRLTIYGVSQPRVNRARLNKLRRHLKRPNGRGRGR